MARFTVKFAAVASGSGSGGSCVSARLGAGFSTTVAPVLLIICECPAVSLVAVGVCGSGSVGAR